MIRKLIAVAFSLAVIVALYLYVSENGEYLSSLVSLTLLESAFLVALTVLSVLARGAINLLFYNDLGASLSRSEATGLAIINTLGNLLPLSAGLLAKGAWLREKHDIPVRKFISATLALFIVFLSVNGFLGFLSCLALILLWDIQLPFWLPAGLLIMSFSLLVLFIPMQAFAGSKGKLGRKISQLHDGWTVLLNNRRLLCFMLVLQAVCVLLVACRFMLVFRVMSQDIGLTRSVVFSSSSILTRIINIAPGGLGIREGIVAGIGTVMDFDFGISAIAVGIDRVILIAVCLLTLPFTGLGRGMFRNRKRSDDEGAVRTAEGP